MTTIQSITFEVCVTPRFDNLTPLFDVMIYRNVEGGVCGPFSDDHVCSSLETVDNWLGSQGFTRTAKFGPVCANGFATAPLEVMPTPGARARAAMRKQAQRENAGGAK